MLRQFRSLGPKFVVGGLVLPDVPLLYDLAVAPVANLDELPVQRFVPPGSPYRTSATVCLSFPKKSWSSSSMLSPASSANLSKRANTGSRPTWSPEIWLLPLQCQTVSSANIPFRYSMSPPRNAACPFRCLSMSGCSAMLFLLLCCGQIPPLATRIVSI